MKILELFKAFGFVIGLGLVAPAWGVPITSIDKSIVGDVDELYESTRLKNSGDDTELTWVAGVLGIAESEVSISKTDVESDGWLSVTGFASGEEIYAYLLDLSDVDYFLVKTGNKSTLKTADGKSKTHFLMSNLDSVGGNSAKEYAVINLKDLGLEGYSISKVSHVSSFAATAVPEPAPLAILAVALLGGGLLRRFNQKIVK